MRRRIGIALAAVAGVVVVVLLVLDGDSEAGTLDISGTVEAVEADLGFNLPGRLREVPVREGDHAEAGAVLARLDAAELEARRSAAAARLDGARALLAEMEAGARGEEVAQGRAAVRAADRRAEDAARDLERARALHEGGAISQEALDKARTAAEVAASGLEQAREQLAILERGPRRERIDAQRAAVASTEAALREIEARIRNATIEAPFSGRVTIRHREPGETVQPGQPVITLLDPGERWVQIYVPEDRIGAVSIGQEARITSDSYPDRSYGGRVTYIAGEAEFTPRNVQTKEERVKLVYAVRVRVVDDPDFVLKPGVPADVTLRVAGEDGAE